MITKTTKTLRSDFLSTKENALKLHVHTSIKNEHLFSDVRYSLNIQQM